MRRNIYINEKVEKVGIGLFKVIFVCVFLLGWGGGAENDGKKIS